MAIEHVEREFEDAIEASLLSDGGYEQASPDGYDKARALFPSLLLRFVKSSQPEAWKALVARYGGAASEELVEHVHKRILDAGTLTALHDGVAVGDAHIDLSYSMPYLKDSDQKPYEANICSVTRQLHYSETDTAKSVDLVLALNGLPVATAELKHAMGGQGRSDAERQYMTTRDPSEPLFQFKRGALVHFAVDPYTVSMTTHLEGRETQFLPFNTGRDGRAGNPSNFDGFDTEYLWKAIWARDSWLDILARFITLERHEDGEDRLIFPRYHQLDAVRELISATEQYGAGTHYLIQHSPGSGKSNTIAWLAYRLHNLVDGEGNKVFDMILVGTDRRVLDRQLRDTVGQFEKTQGVVTVIDKNSTQLREALRVGSGIVTTTVQKFRYIAETANEFPSRRYAVIVDEAHSSQGGKTSKSITDLLAKGEDSMDATATDGAEEAVTALRLNTRNNLSFYAFTATPKPTTMQLFGTLAEDGKRGAFHTYTMRQAIDEGFIVDVLTNYITYRNYYQLRKMIEADPLVEVNEGLYKLSRLIVENPVTVEEKAQIVVHQFMGSTFTQLDGRAKAMVVASSRKDVVRYKVAIEESLAKIGHPEIGVLGAFTGGVRFDGDDAEYSEESINGFKDTETQTRFKMPEYRILVVANKFQTGFDEPLLQAMFVDKALEGLSAVQTLSRLNRRYPGKKTLVVDFKNHEEDIYEAFSEYMGTIEMVGEMSLDGLHEIRTYLDSKDLYDMETVRDVYLNRDLSKKMSAIHESVSLTRQLDGMEYKSVLANARKFVRVYTLFSQVSGPLSLDLAALSEYLNSLTVALAKADGDSSISLGLDESDLGADLDDSAVGIATMRMVKSHDGAIEIEDDDAQAFQMPTPNLGLEPVADTSGSGEFLHLSELIDEFNRRHDLDIPVQDRQIVRIMHDQLKNDMDLYTIAMENTFDDFRTVAGARFDTAFNAALHQVVEIGGIEEPLRLPTNQELRDAMFEAIAFDLYRYFRAL